MAVFDDDTVMLAPRRNADAASARIHPPSPIGRLVLQMQNQGERREVYKCHLYYSQHNEQHNMIKEYTRSAE